MPDLAQADDGRLRPLFRGLLNLLLAGLVIAGVIYYVRFRPVAVGAYRVSQGSVVAEVMGTGRLDANVRTTVSAKMQGRIVKLGADQNDRVAAGQLLAQLDDVELLQQVHVAESTVATATAALERVQADRLRAEAALQLAQINYDRVSQLHANAAAAQIELDTRRQELRVAEAEAGRAEAAVTEAQQQINTARNNLGYQQALLENTHVLSAFGGVIVRRDRQVGDVISPGASIFQLVSTEDLWVSVWVDETALAALAPGQLARVVFRSEPDKPYPGRVVRIGREVDRQTREFLVDIAVESLPTNWAVGQRAEAYVETGRKNNVLVLPAGRVLWRDGDPGVYVDVAGRAKWQPLKLGLRGPRMVEVVEGLTEAQTVVFVSGPQAQAGPLDGKRVALP